MRPISVHLKEIREKGWSELVRKIKRFYTEDKLFTTSIPPTPECKFLVS